MTWNKTTEPKSAGWYLCTCEEYGKRWVMPIQRYEVREGHFRWDCNLGTKIVACAKFPKPYEGVPR